MKQQWDKLWDEMVKVESELTTFQDTACLSAMDSKRLEKFIRQWNRLKKQAAEFDKYISPVEPIEVKLSYQSDLFREMWQRWKDYLSEQHGQLMKSRSEVSALEHLKNISKGNEDKAISFLLYAMSNRYKNFFAIDEKDTKQPAKGESAGSGSAFDD